MNNIYIPDNLILVRNKERKQDSWLVLYGLGNTFLPSISDFNCSYYYNSSNIPITALRENWSKISKGIVPSSCKEFIKIVPNQPFFPKISEVWWEGERPIIEDEVYGIHFSDPSRNISFNMIDQRDNNSMILKLGIDGGRVIRDTVVAFKYSSRDNWNKKNTKFPYDIILISPDDPDYEEAMKESEEVRKFHANGTPKISDLIPGHFYRKKGHIKEDDRELRKIVVFLGDGWKIANGEHMRSPFNPGDKFSRFPMFLEMEYLYKNGTKFVPDSIANICSFPTDQLLCPLPEYEPLQQFEIDEIKERFEASPWSQKFWKTPGYVKNFSLMKELTSISEPACGRDKGAVRSYEVITKKMYDNPETISSLETVKYDCRGSDNWVSDWSITNYYFPITLDCSDKSKPLQIINTKDKALNTIDYLGGKDWIFSSKGGPEVEKSKKENYLVKKGCGIEYYTSDDRFVFRDVASFLTHPCVRLALTGEGDYKSWRIADPTQKEINRLMSIRK